MSNSSKKKQFGMNIGSASILLVFVILCLVSFAVLSIVSANADSRLSTRVLERTTARSTITAMPDADADEKACAYLQQAREACDSVGGCMECLVEGLPVGIGDPVFEKLDANLAKAIMSIGAVKAVEIGDGAEVSRHTGSENNDPFRMENGKVTKISNHSGGILGGMSDGSPIIVRAYVKPTPSIFRPQQTVNRSGENTELTIRGRHDPIIVPRAVVVMECMTAITVLDAMMMNMSAKLDSLVEFYR